MRKILPFILGLCLLLCPSPAAGEEPAAPGAEASAAATLAAATVSAHIDGLYDSYCHYYTADEFQLMYADYNGAFGGVGVSMTLDQEGYVVVYAVLSRGPARDTRIQAGDRIIAVDGESIIGFDTSQAALAIRGKIGAPVELTLLTPEDEEYSLTITRQEIIEESVEGERIEEAPNTAYILVYDFNEQTAAEFAKVYSDLRAGGPIDHLILDLRSNGGGSFFAAIDLAGYFTPAGETVVSEKQVRGLTSYESQSGKLVGTDLLVLENQWTASASEVLAGALRDQAGAVLIGSASFGKGVTQSLSSLESGACWKYTRSRYYTPSGYDLHGVGLLPDIEVELPPDITNAEYFSTDPQENPHLAAAVEYIEMQ